MSVKMIASQGRRSVELAQSVISPKLAAVIAMRMTIEAIKTEPMTTGPIGSWNGTVDLFEIC